MCMYVCMYVCVYIYICMYVLPPFNSTRLYQFLDPELTGGKVEILGTQLSSQEAPLRWKIVVMMLPSGCGNFPFLVTHIKSSWISYMMQFSWAVSDNQRIYGTWAIHTRHI